MASYPPSILTYQEEEEEEEERGEKGITWVVVR